MKFTSTRDQSTWAILLWLAFFALVLLIPFRFVIAADEPPDQYLNTPPLLVDPAPIDQISSKGSDTIFAIYLPIVHKAGIANGFLNIQDRQTVVSYYQNAYANAPQPAINWTGNLGNCVPGQLAADYQAAVLARINFFRRMAGVPAQITFLPAYNEKAQAAALMMSRNNTLMHNPPSDWLCFTTLGKNGASSSNLAMGAYGWVAIDLYMKDPGDGNGFVGHRRWILYPQTQNMGSGDIPPQPGFASANALVVLDNHFYDARPPTREAYVAWPPPGYVPYNLVQPRWSFSYAGAKFENATISMQSLGKQVPVIKESVHEGYGENTIVWIPDGLSGWSNWPRPASDRQYVIKIQNVLINNVATNFQYNVIVIDPEH